MHQPVPSVDASRPDARSGRRRSRFLFPVPALLLGALCLFNTVPAEAQSPPDYPLLPQNVQVTPGDGRLTLTWEAPSSWGIHMKDRYEIDWRVGDDGTWVDFGKPGGIPDQAHTVTSYTFEGTRGGTTVTNGVKYCLRIRATSRVMNMPDDPDYPGFWAATTCGTPVARPTTLMLTTDAANNTAAENIGTVTVTATLNRPAGAGGVSVTLAAGNASTATATDDYRLPTTFRIGAGERTATGNVTIVDDAVHEGNETLVLTTAVSGLAVTPVTLTIVDNESTPTVFLALSPSSISENGGVSTVSARLSGASSRTVTVTVSAAAVSPAVNSDFTQAGTTLTIAAGSTASTGTVTITANDNNVDAPNKTVTMSGTASGGGVSDPPNVLLTITDDEGTPTVNLALSPSSISENGGVSTVTASLSGALSATVTVTVSATAVSPAVSGDFTQAGTTLTIAAGSTASTGTVTITAVDNSVNAPSKTVTVSATARGDGVSDPDNVTLIITDDESTPTVSLALSPASIPENGGTSTVTASLSGVSASAVTVTVSAAAVSPAVPGDFRLSAAKTLTIAAGRTTSTGVVRITAVDNAVDAADKTVTVSGTASGGEVLDPIPVTLTIRDDDSAPTADLVLTTDAIDNTAAENVGTVTVTATLNQPADAGGVSVTLAADNASTATATADYRLPATFTIDEGERTATGDVTIVDDDVAEGNETLVLTTAVSGLTAAPVTLTITDDDLRGVAVSPTSLAIRERGTGTYTLVLTSEPTESVRVAVASSNPSLVKASPVDLMFTASNWDQEQTVTVTVAAMAPATSSAELTHQVTSTGDYASVTAPSVRVTVRSSVTGVNDELLPRITQAMMSSTHSAISRRMDMANPNVDSEGPHTFGGQASLEQVLASLATATKGTTSLDLRRALGGKEFVLPFNAAGRGTESVAGVWGRGDYRNLGGGDDRPTRWDGDLTSIHVGVDWEVRPGLLAGVMVSWSDGKFDYQNRGDPRGGTYDSELASVHPYMSWMSSENALQAWATIGYGRGEVEINDGSGTYSSDTRLKTAAVGVSAVLASEHNQIMFGTSTLRIKAEGSVTEIEAEGGDGINPLTADIERARVVLEGRHVCERGPGEWLIPWIEAGARFDGGDGLTGTGVEIGTGVRYSNVAKNLTAEGEARYLVSHSEDYDEWGFHGEVRIDPGADGRGLSISFNPSLGQPQRVLASLWARDGPGSLPADERQSVDGRLDAQVEYGLPAVEGRGLLAPYARLSLAGRGGDFRVGSRLEIGSTFSLNVEAGRFGAVEGSSSLGIGFFVRLLA